MELQDNKIIKYIFIISLIIFCTGMTCLINIPDNDLWARLIAGGYIVENLSIPKFDFLSYTPTHPWYDHEWGASIFFYLALKYFGDSGLIILKGILISLIMLICYKTVELRNPKSTIPYNILYFIIMFLAVNKTFGNTIRCLLFTCLFFALFLYILEKVRTGKNKYLILLPVIMLFWGNIHGGCISGIGLIGIYCIGEFLNKKPIKNYIITLFACIAVLFINPYGFEYVKFLFSAALMNREYISEWTSPFHPQFITQYLRPKFYMLVMILVQISWLIKNKIKYKDLDKTKLLTIVIITYLSLTHIRHLSFFVLTAGTLLYDEFYEIFNTIIKFIGKIINIKDKDTIKSIILFKEVCVYILIIILALPPLFEKDKQIRITETKYPRYAIEFIQINKLKGNLFVNFDWGSYAAYKLYPDNLIVMDGRYEEVYNPDLLLSLKDFHLLKNDWYKIIRDYKTDVLLLEKKFPVYNEILKNKDWSLVFENNLSGVFVPSNTVKEEYLLPIPIDDYYNKTKFNTNIRYKKAG